MPEVAPQPAAPSAPPPAAPAPAAPVDKAEAVPGQPAPADSAPATAPDGQTPETPDQAEKRGTRRFDRKIDRLHRRAAEAEARAALFEKQLTEVRQQQAPPVDPAAPRLDQFDDVEKYAASKAKYESEKTLREHTTKQQSNAQKQQQALLVEDWEAKAERAAGKYDDFDEIVGELKPVNALTMAIMEAENAEDVAYYLGKNLKEAQRIAALPPVSQIREIGKIEAKLLAAPPKPKSPSKAPAPITPLTGATPVASDVPSETDDYPTWFKKRQKQVHGARRR